MSSCYGVLCVCVSDVEACVGGRGGGIRVRKGGRNWRGVRGCGGRRGNCSRRRRGVGIKTLRAGGCLAAVAVAGGGGACWLWSVSGWQCCAVVAGRGVDQESQQRSRTRRAISALEQCGRAAGRHDGGECVCGRAGVQRIDKKRKGSTVAHKERGRGTKRRLRMERRRFESHLQSGTAHVGAKLERFRRARTGEVRVRGFPPN